MYFNDTAAGFEASGSGVSFSFSQDTNAADANNTNAAKKHRNQMVAGVLHMRINKGTTRMRMSLTVPLFFTCN